MPLNAPQCPSSGTMPRNGGTSASDRSASFAHRIDGTTWVRLGFRLAVVGEMAALEQLPVQRLPAVRTRSSVFPRERVGSENPALDEIALYGTLQTKLPAALLARPIWRQLLGHCSKSLARLDACVGNWARAARQLLPPKFQINRAELREEGAGITLAGPSWRPILHFNTTGRARASCGSRLSASIQHAQTRDLSPHHPPCLLGVRANNLISGPPETLHRKHAGALLTRRSSSF